MASTPFGHTSAKGSSYLDKASSVMQTASKLHGIYQAGKVRMPYVSTAFQAAQRVAPLMLT